jgi:hypothetical protein
MFFLFIINFFDFFFGIYFLIYNISLIFCEFIEIFLKAFVIYKKYNYNVEAINVLLDNVEDFSRASEFAEKVNHADVWSRLG